MENIKKMSNSKKNYATKRGIGFYKIKLVDILIVCSIALLLLIALF